MYIQEFPSNNPFRSISMSSVIDSPEKRCNPFLDGNECKNIVHVSAPMSSKSILSNAQLSMVSPWNHKQSHHSKQDVRKVVSRHERVRSNSESNVFNTHKNAYRGYKYSPFSKEKDYEKILSKESSKEKQKDCFYNKERRSRTHVDRIDLLDVTAVYGSGAFHHDGPFDACNPYRNKDLLKDPVLAFPKDSTSMSFSKSDTESSGFPIDKYFGHRDVEAYNEFSPSAFYSRKNCSSSSSRSFAFESTQKVELLHGFETSGFDNTNFLEDENNEKENKFSGLQGCSNTDNNDLNPKRSFVQRICGVKKDSHYSGSFTHFSSLPSLPEAISNQSEIEKGTFNNKKDFSVQQSSHRTISSGNSESSCISKGLLSRVRSLKVGGSRNNHTEN